MDFEKIEQAYTYLLENVQIIQNDLTTNFYDALIEQNGIYLDGQTNLEQVKKNNQSTPKTHAAAGRPHAAPHARATPGVRPDRPRASGAW